MGAPQSIIKLVRAFRRNIDDYKSGSYNETQVELSRKAAEYFNL